MLVDVLIWEILHCLWFRSSDAVYSWQNVVFEKCFMRLYLLWEVHFGAFGNLKLQPLVLRHCVEVIVPRHANFLAHYCSAKPSILTINGQCYFTTVIHIQTFLRFSQLLRCIVLSHPKLFSSLYLMESPQHLRIFVVNGLQFLLSSVANSSFENWLDGLILAITTISHQTRFYQALAPSGSEGGLGSAGAPSCSCISRLCFLVLVIHQSLVIAIFTSL